MLRYAITERRLLAFDDAAATDALIDQAAALAARGDIDYLQLREKDLPPAALAALARRILEVLHGSGAAFISRAGVLNEGSLLVGVAGRDEWENDSRRPRFLINSRADIAVAVRADGVHLTSSPGELTPEQVRSLYSAAGLLPPTVSLSCHTLAGVTAARGRKSEDDLCFAPDPATAPDLILFGPVFEKRVAYSGAPDSAGQLIAEGSGLELLRQACAAASPTPVLALGGVTEENAADCIDAGAAGVAGIRLFSI